jgi:hypothetical protein
MASVEKTFDSKAFESKFMFSEMCAGASEQERRSPALLRRKVLEFLGEVSKESVGKTLDEKLKFDWEKGNMGNMAALRGKSISSVKRDGYVLANAKFLTSKAQYSYLKKRFRSSSYLGLLIVVRIKDSDSIAEAALIFTWAKKSGVWKIIDFQMACQ